MINNSQNRTFPRIKPIGSPPLDVRKPLPENTVKHKLTFSDDLSIIIGMGTSTRKQREVQQREQMLLEIGRQMLIEHGFAGLSMDRLAEATEYSKGTVYQHFSTKEDLVTAMAAQSIERRLSLFDRAGRMSGRPRERMAAILVADELFARLHPHYFRSELIVKMANLEDRASSDRLQTLERLDSNCSDVVRGLIAESVRIGDLVLSPPRGEDEIIFGMYSLAIGTHAVVLNHACLLKQWAIGPPFESLRRNFQALLDGYGIRPLSTEWDYEATRLRAMKEVFPDECRLAGLD